MDIYQEFMRLIKNNKLKSGQKITLCYRQEFGGLTSCHSKFYYCEKVPLYKNSSEDKYVLKIYYIPAGKKILRVCNISSRSCIVLFNGFVDIDVDEINYNVIYNNGLKILESKYQHFSDEVFKDLVKKYPSYLLSKV